MGIPLRSARRFVTRYCLHTMHEGEPVVNLRALEAALIRVDRKCDGIKAPAQAGRVLPLIQVAITHKVGHDDSQTKMD